VIKLILVLLGSYLLGSIPFALIVSLPQGVDPRKAGSKNPGATNVARLLGKKWGIVTFLGDASKGILAIIFAGFLSSKLPYPKDLVVAGAGVFAVLGHMFSVFLRFKGGKGVATTVGVFLYLTTKAMLVSLILFVIATGITGFVSVGSLAIATSLPIIIKLFHYPSPYFVSSLILGAFIWIKHKDNIKRLLRGEEKTWKKRE